MRDVCGHWRNGVPPIRRQPRSNNLQRPWWQLTGAREVQKQREFELKATSGSLRRNARLHKRSPPQTRRGRGAQAREVVCVQESEPNNPLIGHLLLLFVAHGARRLIPKIADRQSSITNSKCSHGPGAVKECARWGT